MTTKVSTFSLRLPISLKAAIEKLAEADGTSMNQFLFRPQPADFELQAKLGKISSL